MATTSRLMAFLLLKRFTSNSPFVGTDVRVHLVVPGPPLGRGRRGVGAQAPVQCGHVFTTAWQIAFRSLAPSLGRLPVSRGADDTRSTRMPQRLPCRRKGWVPQSPLPLKQFST